MTIATTDIQDRLYEATMRVERIVHLPSIGDTPDDETFEFLTESAGKAMAQAFGVEDFDAFLNQYIEEDDTYREQEEKRAETFAEELGWKKPQGWIVAASQPVFTKYDNGISSFSWGHYSTRVFYGATYDDALEQAIAWGEAERA